MQAAPREIIRPRWTSASFLLYAGVVVVADAAGRSVAVLSRTYGDAGLAGWTAVILLGLGVSAVLCRLAGSRIATGVFVVATVGGWGVLVGALEVWFGWLPRHYRPFHGTHPGVLLLVFLILLAAVAALRMLRFPLLVAPVVAALWYLVAELVSGGGNWSAAVSLALGLVFLLAGLFVDRGPGRPYGFWLHTATGVAVGGALLWFWHHSETDWALIAATGVVYVGLAALTRRSSYAVLGALGLYAAANFFAGKWSGPGPDFLQLLVFLVVAPLATLTIDLGAGTRAWAAPLTLAVLGYLLVALGLLLERLTASPSSAASS